MPMNFTISWKHTSAVFQKFPSNFLYELLLSLEHIGYGTLELYLQYLPLACKTEHNIFIFDCKFDM